MKQRPESHMNAPMAELSKYEYVCLQMFQRQLGKVESPRVEYIKEALEEAMQLTERFFEATEGARQAFDNEDDVEVK